MNTKFPFDTKNILKYFLGVTIIVMFFLNYSCKDDASLIGADLIPDGDIIELLVDTTLTFDGFVLDKEDYSTKYNSSVFLGQINDPSFGKTSAYFASQYILTSTTVAFVDAVVDSVALFLRVDSLYGSFDKTKEIKTYIISRSLSESKDTIYKTSTPVTDYFDESDLISTGTSYQGDTLIKVNLTNTFGEFLIPPVDSIYYYRTVSKFLEKYKGVAVLYEETPELGGLANVLLSSTESQIVLYYRKPDLEGNLDTLTYSYKFNTGVKFNNIQHDFSDGLINDFMVNDSTLSDSLMFLQGLGGITSRLVFNNYASWLNYNYSIINAKLILPVYQDDNFDSFTPPSNLYFIYSDSYKNLYQISDYGGKFFGGYYNEIRKEYEFDISKHLGSILNNVIKDSTLFIRIYNSSNTPSRVILKTGDNIKLKVTYTKH